MENVKDESRVFLKGYKCLRCEHKWFPRTPNRPGTCPKCKSPYFDKRRRKELKERQKNANNEMFA